MEKNELIKKSIIISGVIGIVLAIIILTVTSAKASLLIPIPDGTVLAYHDELSNAVKSASNLQDNQEIGVLSTEKSKLNIKYNAGYSSLSDSIIMTEGSNALGEIGCAYLKTTAQNGSEIEKSDSISIEGVFGAHKYIISDAFNADNEYQVLSYASGLSSSVAIYYQKSDGAGLSEKYRVLIFEEVE